MNLPQELLDEIFNHLPSDRTRPFTLRSCSLVSKSWLEPTRRLLFSRICLDINNYERWLVEIPPTNIALLRQIRSLTYFLQGAKTDGPRHRLYALGDYLPSLCQLQTLTLCNMNVEPTIPEHLYLFSAFQHTLSSLSISWVSIPWSSFVALVGNFPQLRNLEIIRTSFEEDHRPVHDVPHPGRGRLFVDLFTKGSTGIPCHRFAELKAEYEELEILGTYDHHLVAAVGPSLKSLKVNLGDWTPSPGLSRCPELRQLAFTTVQPREQERTLISSITSTKFEKLTFVVHRLTGKSDLGDSCWVAFDDTICGLVDRLKRSGWKYLLAVEFRADVVENGEEIRSEYFLPKFKEKGRVRIVEVPSWKLWE